MTKEKLLKDLFLLYAKKGTLDERQSAYCNLLFYVNEKEKENGDED